MNFFCIADKESSLGFKFCGVTTQEISTKSEAQEALRVALTLEDMGIIIVTEKAATFLRQEIDKLLYKQELPLVIEVPSRGVTKQRKSAAESLKEIIGIGV